MWLASLWLLTAYAQDGADSRAAELAKLRREVETLSDDLQQRKDDLRNRLKAIEAQRLEIEVQTRREELRLAQVLDEEQARRTELSAHADVEGTLEPALRQAIADTRALVSEGLPFHTTERLAELDRLTSELDRGQLTPAAGVARLWAFTEDEMRLSRENGLDRQVVPLPSGDVLADVARIGMVALYFRTDGDVVGAAVNSGSGWTWTTFDSRDEQLEVAALFDKMKHGVRTGAFTLPDAGAAR
ncbi:MAG: DUF3450 family protein [Myxococcota bacterium]